MTATGIEATEVGAGEGDDGDGMEGLVEAAEKIVTFEPHYIFFIKKF